MHGNLTALINDLRINPYSPCQSVGAESTAMLTPLVANVAIMGIAVGGWPMFFVVALRDIMPGKFILQM